MPWGCWLTVEGVEGDVLLHYQSGLNQAGFESGNEIPVGTKFCVDLTERTLSSGAVVREATADPVALRAAVPPKWLDGEVRTTVLTRIWVAIKPSVSDVSETEEIKWVFDRPGGWRRQDGRRKRHPWVEPEDQTLVQNDWNGGRCAAHLHRGW